MEIFVPKFVDYDDDGIIFAPCVSLSRAKQLCEEDRVRRFHHRPVNSLLTKWETLSVPLEWSDDQMEPGPLDYYKWSLLATNGYYTIEVYDLDEKK